MSVITATTDWGLQEPDTGILKALIYEQLKSLDRFVELTHNIKHNEVIHAYYVLNSSYRFFPEGSVHFIGLNAEYKNDIYLIVKFKGHYFVGGDNGLFSILTSNENYEAVQLPITDRHSNLDVLKMMVKAMTDLASGKDMKTMGSPIQYFMVKGLVMPTYSEDMIQGKVIYVDNFGNSITNISREIFEKVSKGRTFRIMTPNVKMNQENFNKISLRLPDLKDAMAGVMFDYNDNIIILVKNGRAADLCRLIVNQPINIIFE